MTEIPPDTHHRRAPVPVHARPGDPYPGVWAWPGVRLGWQGAHVIHAGAQNATLVLGPPRSG